MRSLIFPPNATCLIDGVTFQSKPVTFTALTTADQMRAESLFRCGGAKQEEALPSAATEAGARGSSGIREEGLQSLAKAPGITAGSCHLGASKALPVTVTGHPALLQHPPKPGARGSPDCVKFSLLLSLAEESHQAPQELLPASSGNHTLSLAPLHTSSLLSHSQPDGDY